MSTYDRRILEICRVEFHVPAAEPWGADWVEVSKAISAAHKELEELGAIPPHAEASADQIRIAPTDEAIVVSYELRTSGSA